MSVIVKNMKMPKNCGECPFIFSSWGIEYYCHLAGSSTSAEYVGREKMTNCPLIELPPHGRLGDLDELYKVANMADDFGADTLDMLKLIADTPTVIEAEGSET